MRKEQPKISTTKQQKLTAWDAYLQGCRYLRSETPTLGRNWRMIPEIAFILTHRMESYGYAGIKADAPESEQKKNDVIDTASEAP